MDTTQATAQLVAQIVQAGLGATSLAIIVWSISPRLKRVSARTSRLDKRVARVERKMGIRTTPPTGVPTPNGAADDAGFDDDTAH